MGPAETPKHICGACTGGFETEEQYLSHKCTKTNHTPSEIEHVEALDPKFAKVSEAARLRGAGRQILEKDGFTKETAKEAMKGVSTEDAAVKKIKEERKRLSEIK